MLPYTYEEAAAELGVDIRHARLYFQYYHIYKTSPIRDLSFKEHELVSLIKDIKYLPDNMVIMQLRKYDMTLTDFNQNPAELMRRRGGLSDTEIDLINKYYKILIEPALLYGNTKAPLLRPLTSDDLIVLLSNMALGISPIKDEQIGAQSRLGAVSKLIDVYKINSFEPTNEDEIEMELDELSPEELLALKDSIQKRALPGSIHNPSESSQNSNQALITTSDSDKPSSKKSKLTISKKDRIKVLSDLTVFDLKRLAKEQSIKGISGKRKQELIELIVSELEDSEIYKQIQTETFFNEL